MNCEGCEYEDTAGTLEYMRGDHCYMFAQKPEHCELNKSPQAEQATASCLSELLDREELEIVEICKSKSKFAYEKVEKIRQQMNKRAGCRMNDCVFTDALVQIISKAL